MHVTDSRKQELCSLIRVDRFVDDLKLGKVDGCYAKAFLTVDLLLKAIEDFSWTTAQELIELFSYLGDVLAKADPIERVPTNMILRVLKGIQDEYESLIGSSSEASPKAINFDGEEMLPKMMIIDEDDAQQYDRNLPALKENLIDFLKELVSELEASIENIATKSIEQIHDGQVILTFGKSKSVEAFLKYANKKIKKMKVIVAESGPLCPGHGLAIRLAEAGIETTLIPDSAIFAVMSNVNKVVIGTHSVMANGGLKSVSGTYALSLAAKYYSVPLTVCTPIFKICPDYLISHDQVAFNKFSSPHEVFPYQEAPCSANAEIINPVFDYVPPELVNGFVTNWGCYNPSYVYRLLSELFHRRDYL